MPPRTYLLPPATGTMHSLFLSSTRPGLHGSIFAFHLHTLSLSSGRSRLSLALLRIRIPWGCPFGSFSAATPLVDSDAAVARRTLRRAAPTKARPAPQGVDSTAPTYTPRAGDDADSGVGGSGRPGIVVTAIEQQFHPAELEADGDNAAAPQAVDQISIVDQAELDADVNDADLDLPTRWTLRSAAPTLNQSAPPAVDLMAPADDGTGVANAKLAASAASE